MPVPQVTAQQFADDLNTSITTRNRQYNIDTGFIPDVVVQPLSKLLEDQNNRTLQVQDLVTLLISGNYARQDLENFVYNNGIVSTNGSRSSVNLIFYRQLPPTSNQTIRAGYPVATFADEDTGVSTTFVCIQDTTMSVSLAATYYNSVTRRYELSVPFIATIAGSSGNVGSGLITRTLRPLNGFDGVVNTAAAAGGLDIESNLSLITRYLLSLTGFSPSVVFGIKKIILDNYPEVSDAYIAYGSDTLLVRGATDAGAVDAYVLGSISLSTTETIVFTGVGDLIVLTGQPILSITTVTDGVTTYVQGTDYVFTQDAANYSGSIKGQDGITFIGGGAAPTHGTPLTVTYNQNFLPEKLSVDFAASSRFAPGRDLLFRAAHELDIVVAGILTVLPGFNVPTVQTAVANAILAGINNLKLGESVQQFDLDTDISAVSGVDNFVFTQLSIVGGAGVADINIPGNTFARTILGNIAIS